MSATTFSNESMAVPGARAGEFKSPKYLGLMFFLIALVFMLLATFVASYGKFGASFRDALDETFPVLLSTPGDAAVENTAPKTATSVLTPRMQGVLDYVARRYRVAASALEPILVAAQNTGLDRGLDPLLIVAVIGVESGFNPNAESSFGAQGLMQVIPRWHQDKVPDDAGEQPFLDPVTNVRIGGHVLQEAIRQRGSLIAGLQQYAGASDPTSAYASKVLAEKQRLEHAAERPNRPAA